MSEKITYTIIVTAEQNQASPVHFAEMKKKVVERLRGNFPIQKGSAKIELDSIEEN